MSAKACYTPNGSNRNELSNATDGWFYSPCNNAAAVSMCCAIGPGRDGSQDTCLESGLCYNSGSGQTWRESCTDPTWQDPACLKLFLDGSGYNDTVGTQTTDDGVAFSDTTLTNCTTITGGLEGSLCKGDNSVACCQQGQGVYLYNGEQVAFNPSATTSSTSSATSSTVISSSTSTPIGSSTPSASPSSSSSSSGGGSSTGKTAGIAVGAALGALLLIAVALFIWIKYLRKKKRMQRSELDASPAPAMLENRGPKHEMPGSTPVAKWNGPSSELDGSHSGSGSAGDCARMKQGSEGRYH